MSKPLFRPINSLAENSNIYINECFSLRLLPFIHKYNSDFNYLFWPHLAGAHYSKETIAWMDENLHFVDKGSNPSNDPQARPIENLWGCLTQKVYEGRLQAKTQNELICRIQSQLKTLIWFFFTKPHRKREDKIAWHSWQSSPCHL